MLFFFSAVSSGQSYEVEVRARSRKLAESEIVKKDQKIKK